MADPDNPGADLTGWTFLIGFLRSDVRVAGMSFDITAAEPSELWGEGEWAGQTNLSDVLVVMRDSASAIDRVGIRAHEGDVNGFNIEGALVIADTGGSHRITRCRFSGNNGPEIGSLDGARLTIGGGPCLGNRIDMFSAGIFVTDVAGSRVEISHNRLHALTGAGIWATQTSYVASMASSRFDICDNRIVADSVPNPDGGVWGASGVFLEDDPWTEAAPVRMRALIAGNDITLDTGGRAGGIDGMGVDGARVLFNRVRGHGIAAIDAGTDIYSAFGYPTAPAEHWRIIGNDVSDLSVVNDHGGLAAPIWRGTASSHCLVVGDCRSTAVLDQGTDNRLINVIRLPLPTPSSARAAAPGTSLHETSALKQF